jgi:hypothetical protein
MRGALRRVRYLQRAEQRAQRAAEREAKWNDRSGFRFCLLCHGELGADPWLVITSADRYYAVAVHEACMRSRADHVPDLVGLQAWSSS